MVSTTVSDVVARPARIGAGITGVTTGAVFELFVGLQLSFDVAALRFAGVDLLTAGITGSTFVRDGATRAELSLLRDSPPFCPSSTDLRSATSAVQSRSCPASTPLK